MRIRYASLVSAIFTVAAVLAVYWAGLHGAFFFDDGASILTAPGVRLTTFSVEALEQAWFSGGAGPFGRPIAQLTFAINHYFTGFNPFAFKATNLAIHLICGLLVFNLMRRLLAAETPPMTRAQGGRALLASGVVSALWLLHPIQLLPVLHVVQRMTSLSALFLLASFLLHIKGRERAGRAGVAMLVCAWGLFLPLSVLSKETGVLFPAFALAWELILRHRKIGKLDRFARVFVTVAILSTIAVAIYAMSLRAQWIWSGYGLRPFTLAERMLTEGRVVWFYLSLIVAPRLSEFGLHHDDIAISRDLLTPWTTASAILGIVALVWLILLTRKRSPLVSFGVAWFLIGHMLESTVLPLEIAHEHRNYLPLLGVLIAVCGLMKDAVERNGAQRSLSVGIAISTLLYFPFVTALRAHQFGNEFHRAQLEVQNHPNSPIAQHEAGLVMAGLPEALEPHSAIYISARKHFELAIQLDPNFKVGFLGLIDLDCNSGLPVSERDVKELSHRLRETVFAPGDRNVLYVLKEMSIAGKFCLSRIDMSNLFGAAIANPSVSPGVQMLLHSWYADYLWLHEHDLDAARDSLRSSLNLDPSNPSNRLKWAQLMFLSGEREQARQMLLALKDLRFSSGERITINELLATGNITTH
jgi:hypothetical protein